jgi:hypothetical protein
MVVIGNSYRIRIDNDAVLRRHCGVILRGGMMSTSYKPKIKRGLG